MIERRFVACLAALSLGACAPADPVVPADPKTYLSEMIAEMKIEWPKNRTVKIVCHGHSVPAGYFVTPVVDTFNAYPHLMHVELNKRFPNSVIDVHISAIGGEHSAAGAKRFAKDVLSHEPDLVTIDYALNDAFGAERSREELTKMIDLAKARGVRVLLLTPTGDARAKMTDPSDPLVQQAVMIRKLAAEKGVGLVDSFKKFNEHVANGGKLEELLSKVNHPNRAGHDLVAAELLKWFPK